jgi:CheY-like chemotaxis protein
LLSVLKQIKLNAEIANNGQEVLDKLANEKFDLVFMDIQMPILDGIKTVEIMRKKNDNTLVIAMTANAMNEDKDMCINAGMNDYISKPFKKDDLYKLLYKYFGG